MEGPLNALLITSFKNIAIALPLQENQTTAYAIKVSH